ncbi:MAG: hypothetical protein ACOC3I_01175 [Verrucomicrobiota bacterium]
MKKRLLAFVLVLSSTVALTGQVTFILETFGDPVSTTGISDYADFDTALLFTGSVDVRASRPSADYPGASGGGNVFFGDFNDTLQISGIDTANHAEIGLSFGAYEGIGGQDGVDAGVLRVDVSVDGVNWSPVTYTGPGANGWGVAASALGAIPEADALALRFTSLDLDGKEIRLDDIALFGTLKDGPIGVIPESSALGLLAGLLALVGVARRRS